MKFSNLIILSLCFFALFSSCKKEQIDDNISIIGSWNRTDVVGSPEFPHPIYTFYDNSIGSIVNCNTNSECEESFNYDYEASKNVIEMNGNRLIILVLDQQKMTLSNEDSYQFHFERIN